MGRKVKSTKIAKKKVCVKKENKVKQRLKIEVQRLASKRRRRLEKKFGLKRIKPLNTSKSRSKNAMDAEARNAVLPPEKVIKMTDKELLKIIGSDYFNTPEHMMSDDCKNEQVNEQGEQDSFNSSKNKKFDRNSEDMKSRQAPEKKIFNSSVQLKYTPEHESTEDPSSDASEIKTNKAVRNLLPIRTSDNKWETRQIEVEQETKKSEIEEEIGKIAKSDRVDIKNIHTVVQLTKERKRILEKKKVTMANLALSIIQGSDQKEAYLSDLINFLKEKNPLVSITIKKYAALTCLHVFQDILPGYKIRKDLLQETLKKDTLKAVQEEVYILHFYSQYLKEIEFILNLVWQQEENTAKQDLADTCLYCLGELLIHRPLFNYSNNIMTLLVPFINHNNDAIRQTVLKSLSKFLQNDVKGKFSLEVMDRIYNLTVKNNFNIKPEVLELLMSFRLSNVKNSDEKRSTDDNRNHEIGRRERMIKKLTDKFGPKPTKKQKKQNKKKVIRMKEQMGKINEIQFTDQQSKEHSAVLEKILGIYFRILKYKPKSNLVINVMEGLAKIAHLINIEFFSDILKILSSYLEDGTLGLKSSLHCMSAIFIILSCQDEMLNLDPSKLYKELYSNLLFQVASVSDHSEGNVPLAFKIIDSMIVNRKRNVSMPLVLAFMKRLATMALAFTHHAAAATCLASLRTLFITFPIAEVLLDSDQDGSLKGFDPTILEPEHSNALSSAIWELHLMKRHYHCDIRQFSQHILERSKNKGKSEDLNKFPKRSIDETYNEYEPGKLSFVPSPPLPEEHSRPPKKAKKGADATEMLSLDLETKCQDVLEGNSQMKDFDFLDGNFNIGIGVYNVH